MYKNLKLVTVATHETHELRRFIESAEYFGYDYHILGLGKEWVGGEANNGRLVFPGGGMKVNLLKEYLQTLTNDNDVIVLVVTLLINLFSSHHQGKLTLRYLPVLLPILYRIPKYNNHNKIILQIL